MSQIELAYWIHSAWEAVSQIHGRGASRRWKDWNEADRFFMDLIGELEDEWRGGLESLYS